MMLAILAFVVALILIPLSSFASGDEGVYNASSASGLHYDIPYRLTNGTLVSMNIDLDTYTISARIEEGANGVFELKLPTDLGSKFVLGGIVIFVDGEEVQFQEILSCEYRTLVIPVLEGSRSIEIVGAMLLEPYRQSELSHSLSGSVNRERYQFEVFTNSTICGWEFKPEQKTLQLQIVSGNQTAISVPSAFLGGPLALSFSSENVHSRIVATDYGSSIVLTYDDSAQPLTIVITGTTAIPEFGSVVMIIASLAIAGVLCAGRFARRRGFGVL